MPIKKTEEKAETKHCPYCDNEIKAKAIKCQYCGEFLDKEEKHNNKAKKIMVENDKIKTSRRISKGAIRLLIFLGVVMIIFGVMIVLSPSIFWKFLDILLGVFCIIAGISWIVNIHKDKGKFLGIGLIVLGILLIFSYSQLMGILTIWWVALWGLLRGIILTYYCIKNQKFGWFFLILILFMLFIILAFSDKENARTLAGICIGLSTIIDGIALIVWPNIVNKQIDKLISY